MCNLRQSVQTKRSPSVPLMCASRIERAREIAAVEVIGPEPETDTEAQSFMGRKTKKSPALIQDILRRRECGQTLPEIARAVQVSVSSISNWLREVRVTA
jgi:hypothetical protein